MTDTWAQRLKKENVNAAEIDLVRRWFEGLNIPTLQSRQYQFELFYLLRRAATQYDSTLLQLATGAGKCLGKGTPVMLFDGRIKPVEMIVAGDLLMGPDSKPRTVLSTCSGTEALYKIVPTKGDPYIVNESHVLSVKKTKRYNNPMYPSQRGHGQIENISVHDWLLKTHNFRHLHKGWRAAVDWPINPEPVRLDSYFLGLWLGDGSSRTPSITTGDPEIISYLKSYAKKLGMDIRQEPNSENSVNVHLISPNGGRGPGTNVIMTSLIAYRLVKNKHIPHRYKTGSRDERFDILAGILDTDGHWSGKGFELTLKSERLIDDVIFIARSLGFASYKKACKKTCWNNGIVGDYWRCHINGPVEQIPTRIERKKAPPRAQKKNPLMVGIKAEPIGNGQYFGFEIDGDGLFLLGDFTVTHNTIIIALIALSLKERGRRFTFSVHRRELLTQVRKTFSRIGLSYGIVAAGYKANPYEPIQLASIDTLKRRVGDMPAPHVFGIDEAHHVAAAGWSDVVKEYREAGTKILGVTATPWRLSGQGLNPWFDHMVRGPDVEWLMAHGYLSKYRVFMPPTINVDGVHTIAGDYDKAELSIKVDTPQITGDVIQHWNKIARNKRTVVYCISVAHSQHVASQFMASGVRAAHVDGTTPEQERAAIIRSFSDGDIEVLCNCDLLGEGLDMSAIAGKDAPIECVALLRPTKSLTLHLQQIGRALRPKDEPAIILDHANNTAKMTDLYGGGFPDDEYDWTLNDRLKKRKKQSASESAPTWRNCPKCYARHRPAPKCPECGHMYVNADGNFNHAEGELHEIDREQMRRQMKVEQSRAQTLDQLIAIGKARGYKAGWAKFIWAARQKKSGKRA